MTATENTWKLRQCGPTVKEVCGFTPLLASWEKSSHPSQLRLQEYRQGLMARLLPLPEPAEGLFLKMHIDVERPDRLDRYYDLENYLTPLFGLNWLRPADFVLVSARKRLGGGSILRIGRAVSERQEGDGAWYYFGCEAGSGSSRKEWKQNLHDRLLAENPTLLPPGPVAVRMALRCGPGRNWTALWKPVGDIMGPVLGYSSTKNIFHPNDDRITHLEFHLNTDVTLGYDVDIGIWWRPDTA